MITGRDILYISCIDWNFVWHGPQEIAKRFADAGNRVLYVENMGVRTPTARDAARVGRRLVNWASSFGSRGVREVAPNLYALSPLVLPPFGPRWRREANRRLLLRPILGAVRSLGMRDPLVWTYLPTDAALHLTRSVSTARSAVVYYCGSDFPHLTPHAGQLRESERRTVAGSDVVFAQCESLARRFVRWNGNVHVLSFGVNLEAFPPNGGAPAGAGAAALASAHGGRADGRTRGPVIGYVGGLHRHVDIDLLCEMARARPGWTWVFVGPLQTPPGELASLPNVRLLGQRPHEELVHHMRLFDVGIVPYASNGYTETVVPTKINEYLAVGLPVVSTELPTVLEFNRSHDILLTAPAIAESFLQAVEAALGLPRGPQADGERRRVAGLSDWGLRFAEVNRLIEIELAKKG